MPSSRFRAASARSRSSSRSRRGASSACTESRFAVLDVAGFFRGLRGFLDHALDEGLLAPEHRELIAFEDDPARLVAHLRAHEPPRFDSLIGREQT